MIINSQPPLILWVEALSTMVYLKMRLPSPLTVHGSIMTLFEAWNPNGLPKVDHLRIFGATSFVFDETNPKPKLASKAWTSYLVGYEGQHQYRIYNPTRHAVIVRRDVVCDEASIGPKNDELPSVANNDSGESQTALGFPSLCFPCIPWVGELSDADLPTKDSATLAPPTANTPILPSPIDQPNNKSLLPLDSDDELTPPPASPEENIVPQSH